MTAQRRMAMSQMRLKRWIAVKMDELMSFVLAATTNPPLSSVHRKVPQTVVQKKEFTGHSLVLEFGQAFSHSYSK